MIVSFVPPGGSAQNQGFQNWKQMGTWYQGLTSGRRDVSPDLKQKVASLTSSASTPLAKMKAIGGFTQRDIRYVAIELGIGGLHTPPPPPLLPPPPPTPHAQPPPLPAPP